MIRRIIFSIFTIISSQLAAQDSVVLTFTSDLLIDSVRIENLNNRSSCLLKDSDHIVFSFKDESTTDTSSSVGYRQSIIKEPQG